MDKIKVLCLLALTFVWGIGAFPVMWLMTTGDFPGATMFYGLQEDSAVVDWLFTVREAFVR